MNHEATIEYVQLEHIGLHSSLRIEPASMGLAVEITGGGDIGKTTVLDAVILALTGKAPRGMDRVVTNGEDEGWVKTKVAGVDIQRRIKDGKTAELKVRDTRGSLVTSRKQEWLDEVFAGAGVILRPMKLYEMKPKELAGEIMRAMGIDRHDVSRRLQAIMDNPTWTVGEEEDPLAVVRKAYDTMYADRRDCKKRWDERLEQARALREGIPQGFDAMTPPQPPPSVGDLYELVHDLEKLIRDFTTHIDNMTALLEQNLLPLGDASQETVKHLLDRFWRERGKRNSDMQKAQEQIAAADKAQAGYNQQVAAYHSLKLRAEEAASYAETAAALEAEWRALDQRVKRLDHLPAEIMAGMTMPVEGMELRGEEVWLDGVPLQNHGESVRLAFCVRIAMALAPAKFVLIDGCERLDSKQRQALVDFIVGEGFQALMTRVTDGPLAAQPIIPNLPVETPAPPAPAAGDDMWGD